MRGTYFASEACKSDIDEKYLKGNCFYKALVRSLRRCLKANPQHLFAKQPKVFISTLVDRRNTLATSHAVPERFLCRQGKCIYVRNPDRSGSGDSLGLKTKVVYPLKTLPLSSAAKLEVIGIARAWAPPRQVSLYT